MTPHRAERNQQDDERRSACPDRAFASSTEAAHRVLRDGAELERGAHVACGQPLLLRHDAVGGADETIGQRVDLAESLVLRGLFVVGAETPPRCSSASDPWLRPSDGAGVPTGGWCHHHSSAREHPSAAAAVAPSRAGGSHEGSNRECARVVGPGPVGSPSLSARGRRRASRTLRAGAPMPAETGIGPLHDVRTICVRRAARQAADSSGRDPHSTKRGGRSFGAAPSEVHRANTLTSSTGLAVGHSMPPLSGLAGPGRPAAALQGAGFTPKWALTAGGWTGSRRSGA